MPDGLRRAAPFAFLAFCWLVAAAQQQMVSDWFIEDSAISFAYARNWVDGYGLVPFPGGERVEGYSNPLWVLLIALGEVLGWSGFSTAKPLALMCTGWALVASWKVAERAVPDGDRGWALVAPAILATSSVFNMWAASGLESALFGAVLLTAVLVQTDDLAKDRHPWSALLWLALALTRPEGLLYAVFAGGWYALASWRRGRGLGPTLRWVAVFWIPAGALLAARVAYFAWPLPMTYYGKIGTGGPQLLFWESRGWSQVRAYSAAVWDGWYLPLYAAGLLGVRGWRAAVGLGAVTLVLVGTKMFPLPWLIAAIALLLPLASIHSDRWEVKAPLWSCAALAVLFPAYANGDWMRGYRWMSLLAPSASVLLTLGLREVLALGLVRLPEARRSLAAFTAPALFVGGLWAPKHYENSQWFASDGKNESPQKIRRRVNYTTRLADQLMIDEQLVNLDMDMGAFLWWNGQWMVDMAGLVDVPIALHSYADRAFIAEYVLEERRPHLAHVHGHWATTSEFPKYSAFARDWVELPPWNDGAVRMHGGEWLRRDLILGPTWAGEAGRRVDFDNGATLRGWQLTGESVSRGRAFTLEIGVQSTKRNPGQGFRLLAFIAHGDAIATWDLPLTDGLPPMHQWRAQEVFHGRYALELPKDFPEGPADLGFVVIGPDGVVWPGPAQESARLAAGEALFAGATTVVGRELAPRRAEDGVDEALGAAAAGMCARAEELWLQARKRVPKDKGFRAERRPVVGAALARCWVDEAARAPERDVALLERARRWSHDSERVVEAAGPVADRRMADGQAARAAGDWDAAYTAFSDVLRVQPSRAWARRYAEEARNHRLGLGPLPLFGRVSRPEKTEPPP